MGRLQRSLAALLAFVVAALPAWSASGECPSARARPDASSSCCAGETVVPASCCCEAPARERGPAPHQAERGCPCRVAPAEPAPAPQDARTESAAEREARVRRAATPGGLTSIPLVPDSIARASDGASWRTRRRAGAPEAPPGSRERLARLCVARL